MGSPGEPSAAEPLDPVLEAAFMRMVDSVGDGDTKDTLLFNKTKLVTKGMTSKAALHACSREHLEEFGLLPGHAMALKDAFPSRATSEAALKAAGTGTGARPSDAALEAAGPGPSAQQPRDWVRDLTGPALAVIAGAVVLSLPPLYSVRKVADQASEYLMKLGHLPHTARTWLRQGSGKVAGGVAATAVTAVVAVLHARQPTRSGDPTERLHPAPPSP